MWEQHWEDRGSPWEYDPGPAKNRSWSRLFAETPNYRGFGMAMSGNEEFRWHFGPMFYRGRLGDQQVKVLVVGQEGAQDESLSHRFVHRRYGRPHAAPAQPPRHQSVVPLPQHLRVPDLRAVQRPAADHRPAPRLADRPAPQGAVRLRRRPKRPATGDRRRSGGEGIAGQLGRSPRWHGRPRQPAPRRRLGDLAQPAHGRRVAPRRRRQGRCRHRDRCQLQRRHQPCSPVDRRSPWMAARRHRRNSDHHAVHLHVGSDPVPRLPVWRRLAARPRLDIVEPARRSNGDPDLLRPRRLQQPGHDRRLHRQHGRHRRRLLRRRR